MSKNGTITHIKDLKPDVRNARKHNPRNIGMIERSLNEVGAARSIVIDESGNVLAGNGTIEAAAQAGITAVRTVKASGNEIIAVQREGLTPEQKTKLALYDNRTAELAEWDAEVLVELKEEVDLSGLWYDDELERALSGGENVKLLDDGGDAEFSPSKKEPIVKFGDLFFFGEHRLLCGDSRDSDSVARLMGGNTAKLFATDPPYGVNYVITKSGIPRPGYATLSDDMDDIVSDDLQDKKLQEFLEECFRSWLPFLNSAAWYLWHAHLTQGFFAAAAAADVLLHRQIIWVKPGFNLTRSGMYHWAHEPCFYGWQRGKQPEWFGAKNQRSVWEIDRQTGKSFHPTSKPPELFAIPMRNHLRRGDICAEPFAGSGSQIIAAQQCGVGCFAMEISANYCEAILRRCFEAFPELKQTFRHEGGILTASDIENNI